MFYDNNEIFYLSKEVITFQLLSDLCYNKCKLVFMSMVKNKEKFDFIGICGTCSFDDKRRANLS